MQYNVNITLNVLYKKKKALKKDHFPKGIICIVSISVDTVKAKLYGNRTTFALRVALYRPLVKGGVRVYPFFLFTIYKHFMAVRHWGG